MSSKLKAYLAAILMIFIIGLSFLFNKIALNYASSFTILAHRFLLAALVLLPFAYFKREELKLNKEERIFISKMAILYPILIFTSQVYSLTFISSASAGIIVASQPLLITFFAALILKEKTSKIEKFFLLISVFGAIFIFVENLSFSTLSEFFGQILMFLSCIFLALYAVFSRKNKNSINNFKLTFYCINLGACFFLAFYLIENFFFTKENFFSAFKEPSYLWALLYLALASSLLTLFLMNYSYARLEAYKVGILNNLVPVIAILAGIIFLKEKVSFYQLFGISLIFLGIIGVNAKVIKSKNTLLKEKKWEEID